MTDLPQPDFPGADQVQLDAHFQRDLKDLGRTLKFSNPHELLSHWTWFIQRLLRRGEPFDAGAVLNYLLREIYALYQGELQISARRIAELRADPRVDDAAVRRAQRFYQQQVDYQQQVIEVLPQLRQLLLQAANDAAQKFADDG